MKKTLLILIISAIIPALVSCTASKKIVTSIGEGAGELAEGVAAGTGKAIVGAAGLLKGVGEATAKVLSRTGGAQESIEEGFVAGGEGLKGAAEKSFEGVAGAIEETGTGMQKPDEEYIK
jgi:hypothetical protein